MGLLNPVLSFHRYSESLAQLHAVRALQNGNTTFQNGNPNNLILVNIFLKNSGFQVFVSFLDIFYLASMGKCYNTLNMNDPII